MLHFGAGRKFPRKLIADYISSMSFTVPLTSSAVLSRGFGAGSYTRATTATIDDHESVVRYCLSGEARFKKSRRVRNLMPVGQAEWVTSWTNVNVTVLSAQTDALGGSTAARLTATAGGALIFANGGLATPARVHAASIYVRRVTGTGTVKLVDTTATSRTDITAQLTTSWKRFGSTGISTAAVGYCGIEFGASGDAVEVCFPQIEDVTGQSNQAPAAYVSVGSPKLNDLTQTAAIDSAAWAKTRSSVVADAIAASDGTMSADKLVEDGTATNSHVVAQSYTIKTATSYTAWGEFHAGERTAIQIRFGDTGGTNAIFANVNIATGAVGTSGTAGSGWTLNSVTIEDKGGGWYRVVIQGTSAASTAGTLIVYLSNTLGTIVYNGDGVSGAYVSKLGACETSAYRGDFPVGNVYPFHGAMVDGVKYFDDTNGNSVNSNVVTEAAGTPLATAGRGYLPEDSKINLCLQSNGFGTTWANTRSSDVLTGGVTAPDGSASSWKLVEDNTAANSHLISQSITFTAAVQTFSVFFKAAERAAVLLQIFDGTTTSNGNFNLSTGAVGTTSNATSGIEAYPNGWYRCWITTNAATAAAAGSVSIILQNPLGTNLYNGDNVSGLYLFGAQLEVGSVISTYVPTTTAAVTRNADTLTYPAAGNAGTSGTLFVECGPSPVVNQTFVWLLSVSDGTSNNYNSIQNNAAEARAFMSSGGVSQGNGGGISWANGTSAKIAARFGANTIQFAKNGTLGVDDTVATVPVSVNLISIGQSASGGSRANMPIQMVGISPKLFNDLQLIQSTN